MTPLGRKQALSLALQFDRVDQVISSDYLRAQQTAALFAFAHGLEPTTWQGIHEWNLLSPSRYNGSTHEERQPDVEKVISLGDPEYVDGPGAESFRDLIERVQGFVKRCRDLDPNDTTVVVSHGWFIKALLWSFTMPNQTPWDHRFEGLRSYWSFAQSFEIDNGQRFLLTI